MNAAIKPNASTDAGPTTRSDTAGLMLRGVHKSFGSTTVLTDISLHLEPDRIYGLLGANGVGKTTLMSVICNHTFRTAGEILIDGKDPRENAATLSRMCFIREDQRYNDAFALTHLLPVLPLFYADWNAELADHLIDRFRLPRRTPPHKLSRGQRSALAIVIALASRAAYTFLDEPYLGLDATARAIFYDELIADYGRQPRTIVMSTHLIDEAANLFEEVILLRDGRVALHAEVDEITTSAFIVHGPADDVDTFLGDRPRLNDRRLGRLRTTLASGRLSPAEAERAEEARLTIDHPSLQQVVAALGGLDPEPADLNGDVR